MAKVAEIVEKLNLKLVAGNEGLQNVITTGYTSDLLSDVMGNIKSQSVWVTMQTHKNVMAVASLKDVSAVVIVNGYAPEDDLIEQSNAEDIPLLVTEDTAFDISAKIYELIK